MARWQGQFVGHSRLNIAMDDLVGRLDVSVFRLCSSLVSLFRFVFHHPFCCLFFSLYLSHSLSLSLCASLFLAAPLSLSPKDGCSLPLWLHPPNHTKTKEKHFGSVPFKSSAVNFGESGNHLALIIPKMPRFEVFLPLLGLFCGFSPLPHLLSLGSHLRELFCRCVRGQRPQKMQIAPL